MSEPPPDHPTLDVWLRNPVAACQAAVSRELELRVLPAFPDPGADYQLYARALARPLVDLALAKLKRLYPDDAKRGVRTLLRVRKDAAYAVCTETVEEAKRLYALDCRKHPDDRLAERARRLYIVVSHASYELPSWQGKAADRVGELGDYALQFAYEDWMRAFACVFSERGWGFKKLVYLPDEDRYKETTSPKWRWMMLDQAQTAGQLPWAVPSEVLDAASRKPTREAAVLLILSQTAPLARGRAPASLKRRLKHARRRLAALFPRKDAPESPPNGP
jgi:hypothetical protein